MAYSKKKREQSFMEEEQSEELLKMLEEKGKKTYRDYITLKNKMSTKTGKSRMENQQELLEYYTTEKFNEYFKTLAPTKATYNVQTQQEIKELHEMVQAGHNVCVFGRGSKIDLLQTLHKKVLAHYHTFQVKGYLPSVTDKKIYSHFGGFLIDVQLTNKVDKISVQDQWVEYKKILENAKFKVVILLHSIDGPNLMTPDIQERLSELCELPNVQLVCSLDNIKMVMNWSPITLQKYKFLFFNIDTKQPYIQQLKYRSLKNENKESTEESFLYVWQSLNKNQKQIVQFIAKNALKNIGLDESETNHFTFNELLDLCIDEGMCYADRAVVGPPAAAEPAGTDRPQDHNGAHGLEKEQEDLPHEVREKDPRKDLGLEHRMISKHFTQALTHSPHNRCSSNTHNDPKTLACSRWGPADCQLHVQSKRVWFIYNQNNWMVIILLLIGLASAQYCPYCEYNACSQAGYSFSIYSCSACTVGNGLIPVQIPEPTSGPAAGELGTSFIGICQPCPLYCEACEYTIFLPANYHGFNALNCTDCASGYVTNINNGTCTPCPSNCDTCFWTTQTDYLSSVQVVQCSICATGYALNGTGCVATTTTAQGQITGDISGAQNNGEIIGLSIWGAAMSVLALVFIVLWCRQREDRSGKLLLEGEARQVSF